MIDEKGAILMSEKHFKAQAKHTRKRFDNEMKFRLGETPLRYYEPAYNTVPMPKYSPLFDIFNSMLLRLQAGDIIEQVAKLNYYLDFQVVKEGEELKKIGMDHMLTGMYAFLIGLLSAILTFLMEMGQRRNNKVASRMIKVQEV